MKKFYSIITFVFMAMAAATLTGCDEDSNIAYTIEGVWEGNMYKQGYYDGRYYQSSRTVMQFDRDPYRYTSGAGRWIDYYSDAPWDYFASYITWRVSGGTITIYSQKEGQTYYIDDFSLSDNYFEGYISDGNGNGQYFRMRKTYSPNWGDYEWDGYYWDEYYYAPSAKSAVSAESAKQKPAPPVTSIKPKESVAAD